MDHPALSPLSSLFLAEKTCTPRLLEATYYLALRDGSWKFIPGLGSGGFISTPHTREPGPGDPEGQLYHLGRDPAEQNNLYDERLEVVKRFMDRVRRYRRQQP